MLKDKVILLVDDEPSILNATKAGLIARGFTVQAAEGADAAMHALQSLEPSIIVSDLVMPGQMGLNCSSGSGRRQATNRFRLCS